MEKITKTFGCEIKSVDSDKHTIDVIVSTGSVDRHREIVAPDAFKKRLRTYKQHPVLLSSHDYSDLRKQIGQAIGIRVTEEGLLARFQYFYGEDNPEADWAFKLAEKKVAAFSVGFIAHDYEDLKLKEEDYADTSKAHRVYKDVELVEISQVLIPSNRDAVQEALDESNPSHRSWEEVQLFIKALKDKTIEWKDSDIQDVKEEKSRENVFDIAEHLQNPEKAKALADSVLKACREDANLRATLKEILLDVVEEIVSEDFYRDLLFGKAAQKGHQPTLKDELGESFKEIARELKL